MAEGVAVVIVTVATAIDFVVTATVSVATTISLTAAANNAGLADR